MAKRPVRRHLAWNQPQPGQSSRRDTNSVAYLQIYRSIDTFLRHSARLAALPGNANIKPFWPVLWVPVCSCGQSDSFWNLCVSFVSRRQTQLQR